MRLLFTLDLHDYTDDMPIIERHAVRAMIRRGDLWVMQQTGWHEYKIPGGGIEPGEGHLDALAREVMEETGMRIDPTSVRSIGEVIERRRDYKDQTKVFSQRSFYYLCDAKDTGNAPTPTPNELRWGLHPVWVRLSDAIQNNRQHLSVDWALRDTRFLEWFHDTLIQGKEVIDQ